jgi:hypothetical protein
LHRSPSTERRSTRAQSIRAWLRHCLGKKRTPISAASEYEDYLFQQWSHGVTEDYWRRPGIYAEGIYDRSADGAFVGLVQPLCPNGHGELRLPVAGEESGSGPRIARNRVFAGDA